MMKYSMTAMIAVCGFAMTVSAGPTFTRKQVSSNKQRPMQPLPGGTDALPFSDNFDSYANGSNLGGQGTWVKWEPASVEAVVSNAQSSSPSNSMKLNPQTDVTQQGNVSAGTWELKCQTYFPSTNVGAGANDGGFLIGMNQFEPISPNTQPAFNWSAQVVWHPGTMTVRNYNLTTQSTPIVANAWVPFRMVINLTTDKYDAYYNGIQFITQRAWSTGVAAGGSVAVACFDFYGGNAVTTLPFEMFFDNVSFAQVVTGCYANCDQSTGTPLLTANDFVCFIGQYANNDTNANCDLSTGTPLLTANDFVCFIGAYASGCS